MARKQRLPEGWDQSRVTRVLQHYETQSEDDAAAEDAARMSLADEITMQIPEDLVPAVRELLAKRRA
jgi:hypothetical protein